MKQQKQKKRKTRVGRFYDLLILILYIVISTFFIFSLRSYTDKYMLVGLIILILILAIALLTFFYNKRFIELMRRIILTLLCGVLIFGYSKVNSINNFFTNLTTQDTPQYTTTQINLLSLQSNEYFTATVESTSDIEGKKIGVQIGNNKDSSAYVEKELNKKYNNLTYLEYKDYTSMISDLTNGYIDVACFDASQKDMIEINFGALNDFTTLIKSFTYKKEIKINQSDKNITSQPFTVLISGNDEIGAPADTSLSDMNMLVMINPTTYQITTVSIPRDSYIPNPALNYENDKLTHTGNNGVQNSVKAVEYALGIDVDFYVKVSFTSLIKIIDALGEISVDIPIAFCEQDENRDFSDEKLICLPLGPQDLNGKQALAFSRHRHSYVNQDVGRNAAQMQVIKGIVNKLLTVEGISKIDEILNIVPKYVITNFSDYQLKSFIKAQIDGLPAWNITSMSLAGGYAPDPEGYTTTASDPYSLQSIYYFSKNEVIALQAAQKLLQDNKTFNDFSFKLDSLYKGIYKFKTNNNVELY